MSTLRLLTYFLTIIISETEKKPKNYSKIGSKSAT